MIRRRRLLIALALSLTVIGGCSRLDWAVRFADTYLMSEADRMFDLSSEQKGQYRPEIQRLLKDIRQEEFPVIADWLESIATMTDEIPPEGVDRKLIESRFTESQGLFRRILKRFESVAIDLAENARPGQDEHFEREFNRRTTKIESETDTPDKLFRRDLKRAERWLDMWIHRPSKEQRDLLREFVKAHPIPVSIQLAHRRSLLAEFKKTSGEERIQWIKKFYENPEALRGKDYAELMNRRQEGLKQLLVTMSATLTDTQKKKLRENLKDRAAEFRRLSVIN